MWAKKKHTGFTIVELLIVIVVIAILAAITIVAYNGVQQRARDARRATDLSNIAKGIQRWSIETSQDFSAFPVGVSSIKANGWYNISYLGAGSAKAYLVNAGYIPNSVDDPINDWLVFS